MRERTVDIGGRSVMLRDAGDPDGRPILYFHGTPGSRLDGAVGEDQAYLDGVRVISFDRPGYGRSSPAPYSLRRIAEDAGRIADHLGLGRFATFGWSGGGPFALATAAVAGDRVTTVGVACGPGPFEQVPGALDGLDPASSSARSHLPAHPLRAVEEFCEGSELMLSVRDDESAFMAGMDALFSGPDAAVLADAELRHHLFTSLNEGLRQGFSGVGWDNVCWVGPWDVDPAAVECPTLLWYGAEDPTLPLAHGRWLADHLADATLVVRPGEGHLGPLQRWSELLRELTAQRT
jgi:pimeloyl-ACP methyl ester carboxylesterase